MVGLLVVFLAVVATPQARADAIFGDDFQDGNADGWKAMGSGDVRLTTYAANASLRLKGNAAAVTAFSTQGFNDVAIGVSFAAMSLAPGDACIAETSADRGTTWIAVHTVAHGEDDGVTLHPGGGAVAGIENKPSVLLRLRVQAAGADATCWADNIRVTGRSTRAELPQSWGNDGARAALGHDELLSASAPPRAVAMSAFAPPPTSAPATGSC